MTRGMHTNRAQKFRRIVPWALGVVILVFVLWDVETWSQFCELCGKARGVTVLRFPRMMISEEEYDTRLSRVLEPLVHREGVGHLWHSYEGGSLLYQLVDAVRSIGVMRHYIIGSVWGRTSDEVEAVSYWDPELAVAAGQHFLSRPAKNSLMTDSDDDLLLLMRATFPPYRWSKPFERDVWNRIRRLLGLRELSPDEMDALVELGQKRGREGQPAAAEAAGGPGR